MVALSGEPPPVGVNFTASPQLVWAATVVHDPPAAKSPAFAPLKLSLTGNETPELLVIVTVFDFVGVPAVKVPYNSVSGVTVAGIVGPVLIAIV